MDWQDIFKLLHVLTFVYWVGADLGGRLRAGPE